MHRGNNRQDVFESKKDMSRIKDDIAEGISYIKIWVQPLGNVLKIIRKYLQYKTALNKISK